MRFGVAAVVLGVLGGCSGSGAPPGAPHSGGGGADASPDRAVALSPSLPLVLVDEVALPGGATRFDYQDVDEVRKRLVVTHMNDGSVLFVDLADGSVLKELPGIPVARGVVVAREEGLVFVTSSPASLVIIDAETMAEKARVPTGNGPDGVGWDPDHRVVGVSDQGDGALSLIDDAGAGARRQVPLGTETGNVVYDARRGWFWAPVVGGAALDQLVAVDPVAGTVASRIDLPDCSGAHGLRLHPDGGSAFVTCQLNARLLRVDLDGGVVTGTGSTGTIPDVVNVDPGLGWLYVAAESGDLAVFDLSRPGVSLVGHDSPGAASHSVVADPATHRVFFPLQAGSLGTPVLRILRPGGLD